LNITEKGELSLRKLIVKLVSVDGAMGGENTDFWKQNFPFTARCSNTPNELLFMPDALLMGQKTYEFFAKSLAGQAGETRTG
jgi:hypothetical protein